jgi:hypothetical protein
MEHNGQWNILTDEVNFHQVLKSRGWLDRHFQGIYERPDNFPDVSVTARVADDDSSEGECLYQSMSMLSYGLFETNGSYDFLAEDIHT